MMWQAAWGSVLAMTVAFAPRLTGDDTRRMRVLVTRAAGSDQDAGSGSAGSGSDASSGSDLTSDSDFASGSGETAG
jgi:hypothetical protein